MKIKVRPTGILLIDNKLLLLKQKVIDNRKWSLPGGTLENNETIEQCLIREFREETGLEIKIDKLLYIADRFEEDNHIVHITFLVNRMSGKLIKGFEPEKDANQIEDIAFVEVSKLHKYGFTTKFIEIVENNFPAKGNYVGRVEEIGL